MNKSLLLAVVWMGCITLSAQNKQISLNGAWKVAISDNQPEKYISTVPVPGLITEAKPSLGEDLDANFMKDKVPYDYVWYAYDFTLNEAKPFERAIIHLRAKYNAQVFLNGKDLGFDPHTTYSHGVFDASKAINYKGNNHLVVKVGSWNTSSAPSKENSAEWWRNTRAPGIWDDVMLELSPNTFIDFLQIIPDVKHENTEAIVTVTNDSPKNGVYEVNAAISDKGKIIAEANEKTTVKTTESKNITLNLPSKNLILWTPGKEGNPKMYVLTVTLKDPNGKIVYSKDEKFGYRQIEIAGTDVVLNGKKILFRAENLAWTRAYNRWAECMFDTTWIRQFVRKAVQDYGFNYMRVHIGHGYNQLYRIASEEGLMLQDEWRYMHDQTPQGKDREECITEFTGWIKENINQTSIVSWDHENEGNVRIPDILADMKKLDPTRYWGETDFRETHDYGYSENTIPAPYNPRSTEKPSTVFESCRLWFNEWGLPEPIEDFKTSRTATIWGLYYFTKPIIWQLQADIQADQGTYYRSARYQAWAPFTLLSGRFNGHTYYLGNLCDSLTAQPNLTVLKELNEPVGCSIDMLQTREWYKDRTVYKPAGKYTKEMVLWNDFDQDKTVKLIATFTSLDGKVEDRQEAEITIPAYQSVKNAFEFTMPDQQGCYLLTPSLSFDNKTVQGVAFRLMIAPSAEAVPAGYMGFGGIDTPVKDGYSALENFLKNPIDPAVSKAISDYVNGDAVDKLSMDEKGNYRLQFTHYNSEASAITTNAILDKNGKEISRTTREAIIYIRLDDNLKKVISDALGTDPGYESNIVKTTDEDGNSIYDIRIVGRNERYLLTISKDNKVIDKKTK
ncbi:MAG: glycoside hydrolase [Candidatus Azobacteroides sp.]|nr:glycoside hydrolase [Candidatus Azobacteroides sp.]